MSKVRYRNVRCVEELCLAMAESLKPPDFLFFWGHTQKGETIDKSCLSNWFPSPFEIDGTQYLTAEHYMMAGKARLFGDADMLQNILASETPGEAKKHGRLVTGFDEELWRENRFDIVVEGLEAKFGQTEEMAGLLHRTGHLVLVEAAPRDRIWGIGMGQNNENAEKPEHWRGRNLLGFALMEVRDRLAEE